MTERLHKTVDLTDEVDDERQVATGVLLTPNQVDKQGDYFAPETIREIGHDFMRRLAAGDAELKFMHAVPAGSKLSLVENRVLESAEKIGDTEHEAGTWVVSVKAHGSKAWQAFKRGLFGGFSIGGEIENAETFEPFNLPPEVGLPDDHPDGAPVRRIDDATLNEFSAVDQPAVPEAQVEVLKAEKADERLTDPEQTVDALVERGHDEEDAELLADVMHKDGLATMTADTTKQDVGDWVTWEQASGDTRGQVVEIETDEGETFPDAVSGDANIPQASEDEPVMLIEVWDGFGDDATPRDDDRGRGDTMHVVQREAVVTEVSDPREREAAAAGLLERAKSLLLGTDDAGKSAEDSEDSIDMAKVGRTLSRANVAETKTVHDAAATMLEREGHDDHKNARTYTSDPDDEFSMADYHAKMLHKQDIPMVDDVFALYPDEGQAEAAAGEMGLGEVAHPHSVDGVGVMWMPGEDMMAYEEAVAELAEDDDQEDGEMANSEETTGAESPADDDTSDKMTDDNTDDDPMADAPEWAKSLSDRIDDLEDEQDTEKADDDAEDKPEWAKSLEDRLDRIAAERADTDQTAEKSTTDEDADATGFDLVAKALN